MPISSGAKLLVAVIRTETYYPAAGAMRIDSTLYYVLKDHLGSASVVTNASGVIVGEQRYYSFGETRLTTGSIFTDKLFTGQREMAGLGIYHYGARFYSPKLGRFLSADTLVPNPSNPQDLNRFSYVTNNPLRYTDPTGHMLCADCGGEGGSYTPPLPPPHPPGGDYCSTHPYACGGGGGSYMPTAISTSTSTTTSTSTPTITPPILPTSTATSTGTPPPFTTPIENYCGGGTNGWYNFFDCGATITQDMALAIDTPFVLLEGALIGIGCLDGPGGCVAGAAVADAIFNVLGANFEETVLSTGFSTVFTFLADVADDGHVGVNTVDAAIPAVAGYFAADPIVDAGIDAYGSGVNHGAWPGIASYIGSLFSP